MITASLIGAVGNDLKLEMMASTMPRLMFPTTRVKISGLEPDGDYRMYLKLARMPLRYRPRNGKWLLEQPGFFEREPIEEKMILSIDGQATGAFFMQNGISFDNVRISFNRKVVNSTTDTMYVRKYFEYVQQLHVDHVRPGSKNRSCKVYPLDKSKFIAVSRIESPRMSQYFAIGFENSRIHGTKRPIKPVYASKHKFSPIVVVEDPLERADLHSPFVKQDPDDFPPMVLSDSSIITRKFGRTLYYPPLSLTRAE